LIHLNEIRAQIGLHYYHYKDTHGICKEVKMYRPVLVLACVVAAAFGCEYPPEHWCDSQEIAKECQVYDICESIGLFAVEEVPPVRIALYYESLCPGCKSFIKGQLAKAVQEVGDIMAVDLVPYGNAREESAGNDTWKFTCQHGAPECLGNVIESCAISLLRDFKAYWPFLLCLESTSESDFDKSAPQCAKEAGLADADYADIKTCAEGSEGNAIEHQMALKTDALNPPHKYTPWIAVNEKHTDFIQNMAQSNLVKYVCHIYAGTKPAACKKFEEQEVQRCDRE